MDRAYQIAVKEALENPETLATILYHIVRKELGDPAFDWDPATVYLELREMFNSEPAPQVMDRISAVQILVTTGGFFSQVDAFVNIANTLADGNPSFDIFDQATAEECAWALVETSLIRDMLPLSRTVSGYIKQVLLENGMGPEDMPAGFDVSTSPAELGEAAAELISENANVMDAFVAEQLQTLIKQANRIPGMADIIVQDPEGQNVPDPSW